MSWIIFIVMLLQTVQDPQIPPVGIIDFYGVRSVPERQLRDALQIKEGDSIPIDSEGAKDKARQRLKSIPGVVDASLNLVCCDDGKAIIYVGIAEKGAYSVQFRSSPKGKVRLPHDILQTGKAEQDAAMNAILKGNSGEDVSRGHSLANDPATRALQERFVIFAERNLKLLRDVLRNSDDAEHRELAAQVIAYTGDKQAVVNDLVEAIRDPAEGVRNNAMRALSVMANSAQQSTKHPIVIPVWPFVEMLNSIEWTDRNKSSWALINLTKKRGPAILSEIREKALFSLVEMSRWKSSGHANAPFFLLGRVAGIPETEIQASWDRGERASFVDAAVKRIKAN